MSHPYVGPLSAYNSLTDKHLTGYFNNTRIRRHLQRSGMITRSGRILTEKEYKINSMRRDHQKYIRQCLAQAIFQKVLDMERYHQIEIKRKLETFARRERIQRIKADHSKTVEEETFALFSPRPPTGPKGGVNRQMITQRELSDSSESVSSPRPNTAPGNMQRPVRLQPLQGYSRNAPKTSSGSKQKESADEQEQQFPRGVDRDLMKLMNTMDHSVGVSPYRLPIINNFMIPAPPPQRKYPKQLKQTMSTSSRGRRFRPTTAPNELELTSKDSGKFHKTILHSNVAVTMVYLRKNVHLSLDDNDFRDEIKVFQQHCGGENLCVFKGRLQEGETFNLISRRHRGFPFSLTFYINGMQVDRLSSCCEYKHRKGARLGGKNGYFGIVNIEGASPCYRCIISMGLDKKPSPPPKKAKDEEYDSNEEKDNDDFKCESIMDKEAINDTERDEEYDEGDDMRKKEIEETSSAYDKTDMEYEEDEEEQEEEYEGGKREDKSEEYEADDEAKDEYDEDFEVEEEKPDEKTNEEGQVDDQVNGKSKSPSDDEKDDLDHEGESNKPSKEATETSDSEKDKRDGHTDSEYEEDKQERKHSTGSVSSRSTISTSSSEDRSSDEDNEEEAKTSSSEHPEKDNKPTLESSENIQDSVTHLEDETHSEEPANEDPKLEETGETEETETCTKEEITLSEDVMEEPQSHSAEGDNEHCVSPSKNVCEQEAEYEATVHMDESASKSQDHLIHDNKHSENEEEGDGRSFQEKIAEAIDHDEHFNSEPEPSDSSTDEEDDLKNAYNGSKYVCASPDTAAPGQTLPNEEAQLETPEIEEDKEIQNNSVDCDKNSVPDAAEMEEDELKTSNIHTDTEFMGTSTITQKPDDDDVEEQNIPLVTEELLRSSLKSGDTMESELRESILDKEEEAIPVEDGMEQGEITLNEENSDLKDLDASVESSAMLNVENNDTLSVNDTKVEEEDHIEKHETTGILTTEEENVAIITNSVEVEENKLVQEAEQHGSENETVENSATNVLSEENIDKEQTEDGIQEIADTVADTPNANEIIIDEEQNENNDNEGEDTSTDAGNEVDLCTDMENLTSSVIEEGELVEPSAIVKGENEVTSEDIGAENASRAVSPETHDSTECIAIKDDNSNEEQTTEESSENKGLPDDEGDTKEYEEPADSEAMEHAEISDAGNNADSCIDVENLTSSVIEEGELVEPSAIGKAENEVTSEDTGEENASRAVSPETHGSTECIVTEDDNSNKEQTTEESSENKGLPDDEGDTKEYEEPADSEATEHAEISDAGNDADSCIDVENLTSSVIEAGELVEPSAIVKAENEVASEDTGEENASRTVSPETHDSTECIVTEDDNSNEEQTTEESSENKGLPDEEGETKEYEEPADSEALEHAEISDAGNNADSCIDVENLMSSVIEAGELVEPSAVVKAENEVASEDTGEENASRAVSPETHESTECIVIEDDNSKEEQTTEESSENKGLPDEEGETKEYEEPADSEAAEHAEISDAGNNADSCIDVENLMSSVIEAGELVEPSAIVKAENEVASEDTGEENASRAVSPETHESTECIVIEDDNSKEEQTSEESSENKGLPDEEGETKEYEEPADSGALEHAEISDAGNNADSCIDVENLTSSVIEAGELVEPSAIVKAENEVASEDTGEENASRAVSPETHESTECIVIEDDNSKEEQTTEESSENKGLPDEEGETKEYEEPAGSEALEHAEISDAGNNVDLCIDMENTTSAVMVEEGDAPEMEESSDIVKTEDELNAEAIGVESASRAVSPDINDSKECITIEDAKEEQTTEESNEADGVFSDQDGNQGISDVEHSDPSTEEHSSNDPSQEIVSAPEDSSLDTQRESADVKDTSGDMNSKTEGESSDQDNKHFVEQSSETKGESSSVNEETAETGDVDITDLNNGAEKQEEDMDANNIIEHILINSLNETDVHSVDTNEENREPVENADSKEDAVNQIVDEEEIKDIEPLESEISQSEIADNEKPDIEQEEYVQLDTPVTEFTESSENIEESLNKTTGEEEEGEVNETNQEIILNDSENMNPNDQTDEVLNVSAAGEEELENVNSLPDNEVSQAENEDPI
ncbi:glutamate-rich protein 3 isoform X2 [Xenopus laevis]|uniref:Glutamate-rich protein 3 isoform X2 n=1 Tax=Xenopus laevis TaxID=8355 RepID=A0A8J1KKK4_XENLA|nr:glutamate-rich protein 3 isoform X2 [Xenopus laevis]